MPKKVLSGEVIRAVANNTIVVVVVREFEVDKYHKRLKRSRKYAVDDPQSYYNVGDKVKIIESKPISKSKRWRVIYE